MNFQIPDSAKEVAIFFSASFKDVVQSVYDSCNVKYQDKIFYLIAVGDVICPLKCYQYDACIVVGSACPLHPFKNAFYYRTEPDPKLEEAIASHSGTVILDSLYSGQAPTFSSANSGPLLVVTKNQQLLNYFCEIHDNVSVFPEGLNITDQMKCLMKENIAGKKLEGKRMFGIVFTSLIFEDIVNMLYHELNRRGRAYKIFLKDISYERLISIDSIDCLVLVDCPLYSCDISLHVPVLSPFSVFCGLHGVWKETYLRNYFETKLEEKKEDVLQTALANRGIAGGIMLKREFQGVQFGTDSEDIKIYEGKRGIASKYEGEE